jgi:hypothetical protein
MDMAFLVPGGEWVAVDLLHMRTRVADLRERLNSLDDAIKIIYYGQPGGAA